MATAGFGPKAYAGLFTDVGRLKLFLDDGTFNDPPVVMSASGAVVDNGDGTVTVTIPDP